MRAIRNTVLLFCAVFALTAGESPGRVVAADGTAKIPHAGAIRSQPWILVGLSPQGCSGSCRRVYSVVRDLSGNGNGIIVPFRRFTAELVTGTRPSFIILSPQSTPWCRYTGEDGVALQNFLWTIPLIAEEMNVPILGICGGHQALALAFGGKVGPIRAGEDDCLPYSSERSRGIIPLTLDAPDPIFRGVGPAPRITASHYDEVKVLPPGFVVLASGGICPIQIMRHPTRPVYGIQGHPERFEGDRPDGAILIRNFLEIARIHNQAVRNLGRPLVPGLMSLRR